MGKKSQAAIFAGAATVVLAWGFQQITSVVIPAEVAAGITTILTIIAGTFIKDPPTTQETP